jgi:hypothetical protein
MEIRLWKSGRFRATLPPAVCPRLQKEIVQVMKIGQNMEIGQVVEQKVCAVPGTRPSPRLSAPGCTQKVVRLQGYLTYKKTLPQRNLR